MGVSCGNVEHCWDTAKTRNIIGTAENNRPDYRKLSFERETPHVKIRVKSNNEILVSTFIALASSERSDDPADTRSLVRAVASCNHKDMKVWGQNVYL